LTHCYLCTVNHYKLAVYTGAIKYAGTDAKVHVTLFGDLGDSGEIYLDNMQRDDFEAES